MRFGSGMGRREQPKNGPGEPGPCKSEENP